MAKRKRTSDDLIVQIIGGLTLPAMIVNAKSLAIEFANDSALELTGRSRRELKGLSFAEIFSRSSLRKVALLCKQAAKSASGPVEESGCLLVRRSGRKTRVSLSVANVKQGSREIWLVTIQSLAAQLRLKKTRERQLREITQVSKLADIGLLTAGVAHELNNPLMIVQGFAENLDLLLDQKQINRIEVKGQAREILLAVERMSRIIRQMTRIVRSTDVHFEITDLKSIIENMTRFIAHEFRRHQIELKMDVADSIFIKCDANQIEQVILNILSNAVHALAESAEPRMITIRAQVSQAVELTISNNGPAIPRSLQDKLMTPFFTTKEVGKGTGLGLSISYGIMKAHGGSVTLDKSTQEGTTFKLKFPRQESHLKETSGAKVMVITTDALLADQLTERIQAFGYRVMLADSAAEGARLVDKHPDIQCLFVDFRVPDVTAKTLSEKQVKNSGPTIALLSPEFSNPTKEAELLSQGISVVLRLPINHNSFSAVMNRIKGASEAA